MRPPAHALACSMHGLVGHPRSLDAGGLLKARSAPPPTWAASWTPSSRARSRSSCEAPLARESLACSVHWSQIWSGIHVLWMLEGSPRGNVHSAALSAFANMGRIVDTLFLRLQQCDRRVRLAHALSPCSVRWSQVYLRHPSALSLVAGELVCAPSRLCGVRLAV